MGQISLHNRHHGFPNHVSSDNHRLMKEKEPEPSTDFKEEFLILPCQANWIHLKVVWTKTGLCRIYYCL